MKNTKKISWDKNHVNNGNATQHHPRPSNRKALADSGETKEKINSSLFQLSPRQYWAGPHFFLSMMTTKA